MKTKRIFLPALLGAMLISGCGTTGTQSAPGPSSSSSSAGGSMGTSAGSIPRDNAAAGSTSGAGTGPASGAQSVAVPAPDVPVLVLVPTQVNTDPALYDGCWARLVDNQETPRQSDQLTVVGKMHMPSLQTASGVNWKGKADGMIVGPNALVTAFGEEQYQGRGVILKPRQVIRDARKELGFVSSIESLKVDCAA